MSVLLKSRAFKSSPESKVAAKERVQSGTELVGLGHSAGHGFLLFRKKAVHGLLDSLATGKKLLKILQQSNGQPGLALKAVSLNAGAICVFI